MEERIKKLIQPMIFIAAAVFLVFYLIEIPTGWEDVTGYLGYAVTADSVLFILYERLLWKRIPWNRPPILKKHYIGIIRYSYNGKNGEKEISIDVKQSWLSVRISTQTDINSSQSIVGNIENEHGEDVLYYTYITNPDAAVQKDNPVQYGTCRIVLTGDNSHIKGKYWTTSRTTGDIELSEVKG